MKKQRKDNPRLTYHEDDAKIPGYYYNSILGPERKIVQCKRYADMDRLADFEKIAEYTAEMKEVNKDFPGTGLELVWTGYEDADLCWTWTRPENDQEYKNRMDNEKRIQRLLQQEAEKKRRKEEGMKELARVKKKYGL